LSTVFFSEERTGVHPKGSPRLWHAQKIFRDSESDNCRHDHFHHDVVMMRFKFSEIFDMQEAVKAW